MSCPRSRSPPGRWPRQPTQRQGARRGRARWPQWRSAETTSSAEPPDCIVKDRHAPPEARQRDPLVNAVIAIDEGLVAVLAQRREAVRRDAQREEMLRVGRERGLRWGVPVLYD